MMEFTAEMIAGFLGGDIVGDKTVKVHTVSSIEEGKAGSMAYLVNPKYEPFLYTTEASIVLVDRSFTPQREVKPTLVKVDDAGAAVLRLLEMYNAARPQKKGVSERASISPEASLGEGCYVGDFAVIEAGARIGDGCRIYPQVYVGDGVEIGEGTTLYPGVKIYEGCRIGSRCILHAGAVIGADGFGFAPNAEGGFDKIPQLGNVIIEDDVEIGANTCIDRAKTDSTIIRRGVKLDNLIQVGHNVQIGEHTVSHRGFVEDRPQLLPRGAGRHRGPRHHRRPREDRLAERRRQERARRRSPHGHAGAAGHQVPPRERRLPQPPRVAAAALRAGKGGQPTDRKISMKRTLAFAASLLLLGACSSDGYTIRGKIAGLDNPYVYLLRYTGEVEVIDSAKVTKGDFVFKGKAEQPEVVYLSTDKQQPFVHFFLENGRISVDGALSAPADIAVLGTPSNDIQRAFDEKIAALEEEFAKAGNDVQRDSLRKEYSKLMSDAVEMNRDNIYGVTTFLNNAYAFLSPEEVMGQIALFPAEWQQRRELTELREATERKLRVSAGHPYIDIAAKNADGGEVSLKSVVENRRNKYVLLDFWASWCGPCMAEIPFLKADYEKYGKKGFEIYAVSFDSQRDRWIDAVRQQGMKWIQVSDLSGFQTPAAEAYAVQSIPSNFLIRCSDGQIVATQLRGEALGEKLGELLGD